MPHLTIESAKKCIYTSGKENQQDVFSTEAISPVQGPQWMLDTTVNPLHCRPLRKKLKMHVQPSHCQGHPRSGSAVLGKVRKLTVTTGSSSCHGGGQSSILISCCLNKCSNKIFIQVFLFLKFVYIFKWCTV